MFSSCMCSCRYCVELFFSPLHTLQWFVGLITLSIPRYLTRFCCLRPFYLRIRSLSELVSLLNTSIRGNYLLKFSALSDPQSIISGYFKQSDYVGILGIIP